MSSFNKRFLLCLFFVNRMSIIGCLTIIINYICIIGILLIRNILEIDNIFFIFIYNGILLYYDSLNRIICNIIRFLNIMYTFLKLFLIQINCILTVNLILCNIIYVIIILLLLLHDNNVIIIWR